MATTPASSSSAAMVMATFQASLRTLSASGTSLAEMVAGVNRYSCSNSQGGVRFTTAFFAELDVATGDVVYVNAGHNVPILRKKSGAVERLEAGGIPVGIFAESPYQLGTTRLEDGDWLVIFTDGVVEAVEEAILNALAAAETMTGCGGHTAYALPLDDLKRVMAKYRPA